MEKEKTKNIKEKGRTSNITQDKQSKKSSKKSELVNDASLIAVIRIAGMVKVKPGVANTLDRLRLRRKYACILVKPNKDIQGMLKRVKFHVAYGSIEMETLVNLIKQRGKSIEGNKKKLESDVEKVAEGLMKDKKLSDFKLKPFFRLHPPRKGIRSKIQYPKGVLGDNKQDINKLIERML